MQATAELGVASAPAGTGAVTAPARVWTIAIPGPTDGEHE
jgi:hypothetical protein